MAQVIPALAAPYLVNVTDAGGNPVAGFMVNVAVTSGGGALSATTVMTNTMGNGEDEDDED